MKNTLTFEKVAQIYCEELGVQISNMEEYLRSVFEDNPIEIIKVTTTSEFFPDFATPQAELLEGRHC